MSTITKRYEYYNNQYTVYEMIAIVQSLLLKARATSITRKNCLSSVQTCEVSPALRILYGSKATLMQPQSFSSPYIEVCNGKKSSIKSSSPLQDVLTTLVDPDSRSQPLGKLEGDHAVSFHQKIYKSGQNRENSILGGREGLKASLKSELSRGSGGMLPPKKFGFSVL